MPFKIWQTIVNTSKATTLFCQQQQAQPLCMILKNYSSISIIMDMSSMYTLAEHIGKLEMELQMANHLRSKNGSWKVQVAEK